MYWSEPWSPLVQDQWASAVLAWRRGSQVRRQIISALMVLKNVGGKKTTVQWAVGPDERDRRARTTTSQRSLRKARTPCGLTFMTCHNRPIGKAPRCSSPLVYLQCTAGPWANRNTLTACRQTVAGQRHHGFWLAKNWTSWSTPFWRVHQQTGSRTTWLSRRRGKSSWRRN
jgi:hypothetical protein